MPILAYSYEVAVNTEEVAKKAGVHKATLLRWLREGLVPEPGRDGRGWRTFSAEQAEGVASFADRRTQVAEPRATYSFSPHDSLAVSALRRIDWDFPDASTGYLTHGLHPYPAKFIPQIPNALIQELSSVGDTILDPFCGSGTTLVEALLLKRHAIGIDANPIACLITAAKTVRLDSSDVEELRNLEIQLPEIRALFASGQMSLFSPDPPVSIPTKPDLDFWFDPLVVSELSHLKQLCQNLTGVNARVLAQASLSSIIVTVSKQDSDTRYVRRAKVVEPGETIKRFERALSAAIPRALEFSDLVEPRFNSQVFNCDILEPPTTGAVDLVVSSPPYPNAYSYHLYHRTRMLWLDMDTAGFKKREIGSHRKYSSRASNGAGPDTFREEMGAVLRWLGGVLRPGGYCCLLIGDSIIRGNLIANDQIITAAAASNGFRLDAQFKRTLRASRKSFNPIIGKIKEEHILILRNEKAG